MIGKAGVSAVLLFSLHFLLSEASPSASDETDVMCYVCQWSGKSGYTSPFRQSCTSESIRNFRKHYVQKCGPGRGCSIQQVKDGNTVVAEMRGCASSATNKKIEKRFCRTNDCTKTATGSGTSVTGTYIQCRSLGTTDNATLITKLGGSTVDRPLTNCSLDTTYKKYFCYRTTSWNDVVVSGPSSRYPGPTYTLGCEGLDTTLWSGSEYIVTTKTCVNNFCNANIATSAPGIKVAMTTVFALALLALFITN